MATELPEGVSQAQIDRYAKLDKAIKKAQTEHKTLNELFKQKFVKLGTFMFGSVIIKRTEASSFDSKKFAEDHPVTDPASKKYYVLTLDASLIEADVKAKYTSKTQRLSVDVVAD